jgi:hypothetical protein
MRRILRRAFNGAAVVSAVACAATVALWVRQDRVLLIMRPDAHALLQAGGSFRYYRLRFDGWGRDGYFAYYASIIDNVGFDSDDQRPAIGLDYYPLALAMKMNSTWVSEDAHVLRVVLPRWLTVATLALLPGLKLTHSAALLLRQSYRHKRQQCVCCGYDLRASPDRCPECGTVPEGKGAS